MFLLKAASAGVQALMAFATRAWALGAIKAPELFTWTAFSCPRLCLPPKGAHREQCVVMGSG